MRKKNGFLINRGHKTAAAIVSGMGRGGFGYNGGCSYRGTMLKVEAEGIDRGVEVEGFGGCGKGEINGQHLGDNR